MNEKIYTAPQVAEYLQLSKSKIYALIQKGAIPHVRVGRNVRIRQSDLDAWLEKMSMTWPPLYNRFERRDPTVVKEDEIAELLGLPRDRVDILITQYALPLDEGDFEKWFVEQAELVLREKLAQHRSNVMSVKGVSA